MDTKIRVSTESRSWRRKFSCRSCRDLNLQPFSHESSALTTELSPPPCSLITHERKYLKNKSQLKHKSDIKKSKPLRHEQCSEKTAHLHCALVDKRRLLRWEVAFLPFSDDHLASEQKHVSLLSSSLACVTVPQDHVILQSSKQQRLVTIL